MVITAHIQTSKVVLVEVGPHITTANLVLVVVIQEDRPIGLEAIDLQVEAAPTISAPNK